MNGQKEIDRYRGTVQTLPLEFYARDTVTVARDLLGRHIVRRWQGRDLVCRITETEAYVGRCDRACHAYGYKRTPRTQTLFAPPGTVYLYLIYGMYHCLNFVTEPEGEPAAVLIRGAQPLENIDSIAELRHGRKYDALSPAQRRLLLSGPGRLCRGLALTREQNGLTLFQGELTVTEGTNPQPEEITAGPRVGIDYAGQDALLPWRFALAPPPEKRPG